MASKTIPEQFTQTLARWIPRISGDLSVTVPVDTSRATSGNPAPFLPQVVLDDGSGTSADIALGPVLGQGGMGLVYVARQRSLNRELAVKVVRPELNDASLAAGLLQEGRITGMLEHPNIVPVHALGVDQNGRPILVLKKIEGRSWLELLTEEKHPWWDLLPLRHEDRLVNHLEILLEVCNALEFAHAHKIVHRDIKPDNVMLGRFGEVYLLDWGIALELPAMEPLDLAGTPAYLAPEMAQQSASLLGPWTDVYLLGATLHHILTGSPRHPTTSIEAALLSAMLSEPYSYPSSVAKELAELCNQAMCGRGEDRPSVDGFRRGLIGYLEHRSSLALSSTAKESLVALQAMPGLDTQLAEVLGSSKGWRLAAEARFGFHQALKSWEGNEEAREGLQQVVTLLLELAFQTKNPEEARILHEELPKPLPNFEVRWRALVAEVEQARKREAELQQHAREMDPSVSSAARTKIAVLVFSLMLPVLVLVLLRERISLSTNAAGVVSLVINCFFLCILFGGVYRYREELFKNTVSKRVAFLFGTGIAIAVLIEVASTLLHWTDQTSIVVRSFALSGTFAGGAISAFPALWMLAVSSLVVGLAALVKEDASLLLGVVGGIVLALQSVWLFRSQRLVPYSIDVPGKPTT